MDYYVTLYILINFFCTVLLLAFALHSRIGMGATASRRYFAAVIYAVIAFFLSDTVWLAMNYNFLPQIWWVGTLMNNIYFLSVDLAGYLWFIFLLMLVKAPFVESKRFRKIAFIPILIHICLCIYNLFDPILFGIDQNFQYFRGPLHLVQYVFYYLYMISVSIYAIVRAMHPENYIERMHYLLVAMFPILPVISGALQLVYSHVPFNCIAFTLNLALVYMNELGQQVSQEPLTQLANRKQFMRTLEQGIQAHEDDQKLYLFMMDVDRLKHINDTYGHAEGDHALLLVSEALKQAVAGLHQRAMIARYAGDEFAIIAYFDDPDDALLLKHTIECEIEAQNKLIEHGYQLRMSIGIAQLTPEMTDFRDLLDAADAQLYLEKNKGRG